MERDENNTGDVGSRVWFLVGDENFSQHHIQNRSGTHPASYPMGTRRSFPGGKSAGAWGWPPTSSAKVKNVWSHTSAPTMSSWHGA